MEIALCADSIVTMNENNDVIKDGVVVVKDNFISYVGNDTRRFSKRVDVTIEGTNKIIIPGLINTHAHLGFTLLRGLGEGLPLMRWLRERIGPMESCLTNDDIVLGTEIGVIEMINAGVTCIADFYDVSLVAPIFKKNGVRGVLSTVLSDSWFGKVERDKTKQKYEDINKVEREIKCWHGHSNGLIRCMLSPHAPYTCSEELLNSVRKISEKYDISIHTHIAESTEECAWFLKKHGVSPVTFFNDRKLLENGGILAHCVILNKEDISILRNKNVGIAHCPTSNVQLCCGISPIKDVMERGIPIGLGTDSAASNNTTNLFSEMRLVKLLQNIKYGEVTTITPLNVLKMSTINAAKSLRIDHEVGSIEVGKKADIVVLNFDKSGYVGGWDIFSNIVYSTTAMNVDTVIVDGEILKINKSLARNIGPIIEKGKRHIKVMVEKYKRMV